MFINYNFAFKNSNLKRWVRPDPPSYLSSDASLKKKLIYLYQKFHKNGQLFYPSSFVISVSFILSMINIYPLSVSNKLEKTHKEYSDISRRLEAISQSKARIKKNINDIDEYFSDATLSYIFTFYLQNSVPEGVQIKSYAFNDNGFEIIASSPSVKSLNDMLTLIVEAPIINKESVTVNQLSKKKSSARNAEDFRSYFDIELFGQVLKVNMDKREKLYEESNAIGLNLKLKRFKELKRLLRL